MAIALTISAILICILVMVLIDNHLRLREANREVERYREMWTQSYNRHWQMIDDFGRRLRDLSDALSALRLPEKPKKLPAKKKS